MANLQIQKFVQLMQIRIIKIFITLNYFTVKFYLYKNFLCTFLQTQKPSFSILALIAI